MKITYRSEKFFAHPGIYLQVWNKWYRILRIGEDRRVR